MARPVDADSLIRVIKIRTKWHKDITVGEVIEIIKDAPTLDIKQIGKQGGTEHGKVRESQ